MSRLNLPEPPAGAPDEKAFKESDFIGKGRDLDKEAAEAEHDRSQQIKTHVLAGTIVILWIVMICIATAVLVLCFHVLTPECWRYLSASEISDLKAALGVLLVSGLLADNARRLLSK